MSSIKNLNHDYEHLQWLRLFYLNHEYHLSEDWINHSLNVRNNKPYFKPAPNFDYMKVATNSVRDADKLIFLMSAPSTFVLTILRYALHLDREVIVICKSPSVLQQVSEGKEKLITTLGLGEYRKRMGEFL
jgi:hypothetical protein